MNSKDFIKLYKNDVAGFAYAFICFSELGYLKNLVKLGSFCPENDRQDKLCEVLTQAGFLTRPRWAEGRAEVYELATPFKDMNLPGGLDKDTEYWSAMPLYMKGETPYYHEDVALFYEFYAERAKQTWQLQQPSAQWLANELKEVNHDFMKGKIYADIGCGSAVWSIHLSQCKRESYSELLLIDSPMVLNAMFDFYTEKLKGIPKIALPMDYNVSLPIADRFIVANVLHLESEKNAANLLWRMKEHLPPGGMVCVIDVFQENLSSALYEIHLGMRSKEGRRYTVRDVRQMAAQAGLEFECCYDIQAEPYVHSAIIFRNPK